MKKIFLILLIIPFFSFLSPTYKASDFVGRWQGEDGSDMGYITFGADGYASVEMDGVVMEGKEYESEGRKMSMKYKIDDTVNPMHVDFIVTDLQTKEQMKMLFIAAFKDIDNMVLGLSSDPEQRPTAFNKDDSILFKRIK